MENAADHEVLLKRMQLCNDYLLVFEVLGKVIRQYAIDAVYILSKTHIPHHASAASALSQTQSYLFADMLVHCFNSVREHLTQD